MTTVRAAASSRHNARPRRDRGEATAQLVIVIPAIILLLLIGVQAAVWFHAAHVATAVAARGAAAGSVVDGGAGMASRAARELAADLNADLSESPTVVVSDRTVSVRVTVEVPRIAPFFPRRVSRFAVEPREEFLSEDQR